MMNQISKKVGDTTAVPAALNIASPVNPLTQMMLSEISHVRSTTWSRQIQKRITRVPSYHIGMPDSRIT